MPRPPAAVLALPSIRRAALLLAFAIIPAACGLASSTSSPDAGLEAQATPAPTVHGQKDTFEIATWNLNHFPLAGEPTIQRVTDVVQRLGLDIIAVQELADTNAFAAMVSGIPGWDSVIADHYDASRDPGLYNPPVGFMYDTTAVTVRGKSLLFVDDPGPFPRSPLALDIDWAGVSLTVIDVHLKALGDGVVTTNPDDEEARRKAACDQLAQYIDQHYAGRRVIVLGDFNDKLGEPPAADVFQAFDTRPDRFYFVDTRITQHGSPNEMSYPGTQSQIDHILITSELFPAFFTDGSDVQTLAVDGFLQYGLFEYEALVSDHRPVYARLVLSQPGPSPTTPSDAGADSPSP